ncbi:dynein regulatory complex subunit 5 [Caerostris darwini]|uniref:Dynein regulatory complex subunit 5 n=1 Tax=Caerostris darwini TaxID=1538125 RepID=A0AAV4PEF0_9ARAC|nr:dynein regulatory complex subunit 5 [Caerostris darwini]
MDTVGNSERKKVLHKRLLALSSPGQEASCSRRSKVPLAVSLALLPSIIICYYPIPGPGLQNLKDNAETEQWRQILELLPLTIPFKYTLPIIDNGIYWERQCLQRWPSSDIWRYNDNWKTMLIERVVQEAIENFAPETSDFDELQHFLKAFKDYDYRLQILKLQKIERKPFVVDLSLEDFDDLLDEFISKPEIHTSFLNLEKVLACLSNLNEFNFILTPSSMDPDSHQLSIPDFNSLLKGLCRLKNLKKFRCSNGVASNTQVEILFRHFITYSSLTELNMSYNFFDDKCCDSIGQLLLSKCPLQVLVLKYNRIADNGAIAIASALSVNKMLRKLDLSLNWIGDIGGEFLAKCLSANETIEDLDLSNNKLEHQGGVAFAVVLANLMHLRRLSLADNNIGEEAGKVFSTAAKGNLSILELDIKFCNFAPDDEDVIHRCLMRNRMNLYSSEDESRKNSTASKYII